MTDALRITEVSELYDDDFRPPQRGGTRQPSVFRPFFDGNVHELDTGKVGVKQMASRIRSAANTAAKADGVKYSVTIVAANGQPTTSEKPGRIRFVVTTEKQAKRRKR